MNLGLRKYRESSIIVSHLWILAVLFYLLRTIAEPLKYLFFASFSILTIYYALLFLRSFSIKRIIKSLVGIKEFLILGCLLGFGIILSDKVEILSLKSFFNFLAITILYLIYVDYKDHIPLHKLIKGWIILCLAIGTFGVLKWLNYILQFKLGVFSGFYESGSSLVSDYNFYAYYFIISLITYNYAIYKNIFNRKVYVNQIVLILFFLNIILTGSRRGFIVLGITMVVLIYLLIAKKKGKHTSFYKNLFCFNMLIYTLLLFFIALVPFRSKLIHKYSTKSKITTTVYRYSTIFIPKLTYRLLNDKLWPKTDSYENDNINWEKYATLNNIAGGGIRSNLRDLTAEYWPSFENKQNPNNLLYNGDFSHGVKFWEHATPDPIEHEIVLTKHGNAIRVSRHDGKGYWPLLYKGRDIYYYKGRTYTFKFKFRVIEGGKIPFKIGWWINEGEGYMNNLTGSVHKLDNEWFEYISSYKFKGNQFNLQTFMNSQHANTVIDFTDIELTCNDTPNHPRYFDEIMHLEGYNLFYNSNFEGGLKFWGSISPDTITHELVNSPHGKAIRVIRKEGKGYWPLAYQGRDIYYYKNLSYHFRFKFKVVEGDKTPFNIGWWGQGEDARFHDLPMQIFPLGEEWFGCLTSYTFKNDHFGSIPTFMNSQHENTIIDFADIELICKDTLRRPMYADEKIEEISVIEQANLSRQFLETEKKQLLSERISRWKYAKELWDTEYLWSDRLIGNGFSYQESFGKKFYPDQDRIDYPHNSIISSFLYSGIIGGLFYIYFLVLSFWYYWKYRKHHILLFILYLITFTFVFISSDSHFNVPIFALLSLVPFITRFLINEKEQKNPL